ncbi:MAG: ACT domain-containing protein [Lachnospiraceae bacterium]|nr:ACT domain-containing protein [Lachnospiraceae bacterium]
MKIKKIDGNFTVCKVDDYSCVKLDAEFCFVGKTDEENSLVCLTKDVPEQTVEREDGWRAFRIEGILDFSLIGILAKIALLLAEEAIGIFVVSTFNTDYVFVKKENEERALKKLEENGYEVCKNLYTK